ncbi:MAG: hypothetical protein QY322_02215 [bacterium]|nr:MAG: hypothetical protein QY322_02215 [bacterium]
MSKNNFKIKDLKLTWWQAGLFKLATISFGIILAVNYYDFFVSNMSLVWATFLILGFYIIYIYFNK